MISANKNVIRIDLLLIYETVTLHQQPETALQINCSLKRKELGESKKKIQTEQTVSGNDVFWPLSIKVNWIVKVTQNLRLTLRTAKLPLILTTVLKRYQLNILSFFNKTGVKQNSSSNRKRLYIIQC